MHLFAAMSLDTLRYVLDAVENERLTSLNTAKREIARNNREQRNQVTKLLARAKCTLKTQLQVASAGLHVQHVSSGTIDSFVLFQATSVTSEPWELAWEFIDWLIKT